MRRSFAILLLVLAAGSIWWFARGDDGAGHPEGSEVSRERKGERSRASRTVRWGGSGGEESAGAAEEAPANGIRGRVLDAITREPIADATVTLRSANGEILDESWSDADGTFLFSPAPLARAIAAQAPGYAFASKPVASEPVLLELDGAVVVTGLVIDAAGAPLAGAEVWVRDGEGWRWPAAVSGTVETDQDGRFRVEDAPAGRLFVHARAAAHAPGEVEVGMTGPGRTRENVRIELRDGGVVAGLVLDASGNPVADATVLAAARRSGREGPDAPAEPAIRTDADGRFRFDTLRAGPTVIAARSDDAGGTASVEVVEGGRVDVEVRLEPAGAVEGTVVDGAGAPIEGALVRAYVAEWRDEASRALGAARMAREEEGANATTSADGRFRLTGLAARRVRITAWSREHGSESDTAEVGARDVVIAIRGTTVRGIVERADGRPLDGPAQVRSVETRRGSRRGVTADPEFSIPIEAGSAVLVASAAGFRNGPPVAVTVTEGQTPPYLRLRLGPAGTLRGRLVGDDGRPVAGAHVSVSGAALDGAGADGGRLDWSSAVRSGHDGRFELPCGGGEVRVFVYHPEYEPEIVQATVPEDGEHDAGAIRLRRGAGSSAVVEFSGIGAIIAFDEDGRRFRIGGVVPGGPAERAGVAKDDAILEVDGEPTVSMPLGDLIARIRGPLGTTVTLLLERSGNLEPLRIDVVREKIRA